MKRNLITIFFFLFVFSLISLLCFISGYEYGFKDAINEVKLSDETINKWR